MSLMSDNSIIPAEIVADYILCVAQINGDIITNLKLQKLLYYAQAWFLVNNKNKKLFKDDIVAWQYGPVIIDVYNKYKLFHRNPIQVCCNIKTDFDVIPKHVKQYLNEFCETFFKFSATELVSMTHQERPWQEAISKGVNAIVNTETMFKYYSAMLEEDEK